MSQRQPLRFVLFVSMPHPQMQLVECRQQDEQREAQGHVDMLLRAFEDVYQLDVRIGIEGIEHVGR